MDRSRRGVFLTPLGEQVLEPIREMVHRANYLRTAAENRSNDRHVRIGVSRPFPHNALVEFVTKLRNRGMCRDIRLNEVKLAESQSLLEKGRYDAILTTDLAPACNTFQIILSQDEYGLCMHKSHPAASRKVAALSDINGQSLIVNIESEETQAATEILRQAKCSPIVISRVSSDNRARALVASGLGSCLLSRASVNESPFNDSIVWRSVHGVSLRRYAKLQWRDPIWSSVFMHLYQDGQAEQT